MVCLCWFRPDATYGVFMRVGTLNDLLLAFEMNNDQELDLVTSSVKSVHVIYTAMACRSLII